MLLAQHKVNGNFKAYSDPSPLFRSIHRFFAIFIAPTVTSRAARKLSHVSCTSNDVKIMNRHQMQTQLQTQEGWWRHAVHTSDQVQENLSHPDISLMVFVVSCCSGEGEIAFIVGVDGDDAPVLFNGAISYTAEREGASSP